MTEARLHVLFLKYFLLAKEQDSVCMRRNHAYRFQTYLWGFFGVANAAKSNFSKSGNTDAQLGIVGGTARNAQHGPGTTSSSRSLTTVAILWFCDLQRMYSFLEPHHHVPTQPQGCGLCCSSLLTGTSLRLCCSCWEELWETMGSKRQEKMWKSKCSSQAAQTCWS